MELHGLIERSSKGDTDAFTQIVRHHQQMVFGYAYALLGDFHLAQDAAQETFLTAYYTLEKLKSREAFPQWLRGIARHHCQHLRRKRRSHEVPLEALSDLPSPQASLEAQYEQNEQRRQVLEAIQALPEALREVTVLYYLREYTQPEIAAFLEVPVSTINNRLHAARTRLKRRMLIMAQEILQAQTLPATFAERIGTILRVQRPLIEVQFPQGVLPPIFDTVRLVDAEMQVTLDVAQHLGNGVARCILVSEAPALTQGMGLVPTGEVAFPPLSVEVAKRVVAQYGPSQPRSETLQETGIKVIDLLCPLTQGGRVGIFGDWGVGSVVLVSELLSRLEKEGASMTLFVFVPEIEQAENLPFLREEMSTGDAKIQVVYLRTTNPTDPAFIAQFTEIDAHLVLSRRLAEQGMWPAIDPLFSTSTRLEAHPESDHTRTANQVQAMLSRYHELVYGLEGDGRKVLSAEERVLIPRARKVQRFLTQPFYVAEPYTQRLGKTVTLTETLQGVRQLLAGEGDAYPPDTFYMEGSFAECLARKKEASVV